MALDAVGGLSGLGSDGFDGAGQAAAFDGAGFGAEQTNGLVKAGAVPAFGQDDAGLVHLAALSPGQRALAVEFGEAIHSERQIHLAQARVRGLPGGSVIPPQLIPGTKENQQMTAPLHWGLKQLFTPRPSETPAPDAPVVTPAEPKLNDWSGSFSDRELGIAPRSTVPEGILQPGLPGRPAEPLPPLPPLITPIPPEATPQPLITPIPEQTRPEPIGGGYQLPDVVIGQEALVPPDVPDTSVLASSNLSAEETAALDGLFDSLNQSQGALGRQPITRAEFDRLVSGWSPGTFAQNNPGMVGVVRSLEYHINKHAHGDPVRYLRSADNFTHQIRGLTNRPDGADATRYVRNITDRQGNIVDQQYITIDRSGQIRTYGRLSD